MKKIFSIVVFSLAVAAFAQQDEQEDAVLTPVAVLPSDGYEFSQKELDKLTDKMREAALKVLPTDAFVLLKQETVVKRLGGRERYMEKCSESSCILELGRLTNVDFVTRADLTRRDKKIDLRVELYNVKTGGDIGILTGDAEKFDDLLGIVEKKAPSKVFGKIPGALQIAEQEPVSSSPIKISFWAGIGLEVLGAAVMYAGYTKHKDMLDAHDKYKEEESDFGGAWDKVESNRKTRNTLYIVGGALLASGVGVHIWF